MIPKFKFDSPLKINNVLVTIFVIFSLFYPSVLGLVLFEHEQIILLDSPTRILLFMSFGAIFFGATISLTIIIHEKLFDELIEKKAYTSFFLYIAINQLLVFLIFSLSVFPLLLLIKKGGFWAPLSHPWYSIFVYIASYILIAGILMKGWSTEKKKGVIVSSQPSVSAR